MNTIDILPNHQILGGIAATMIMKTVDRDIHEIPGTRGTKEITAVIPDTADHATTIEEMIEEVIEEMMTDNGGAMSRYLRR